VLRTSGGIQLRDRSSSDGGSGGGGGGSSGGGVSDRVLGRSGRCSALAAELFS
jgi:hypothetical protein